MINPIMMLAAIALTGTAVAASTAVGAGEIAAQRDDDGL